MIYFSREKGWLILYRLCEKTYLALVSLRERFLNRAGVYLRKLSTGQRAESGATVAEYALVLAIVVVGLILVLSELGEALREKISAVVDQIRNAPTIP